MKKQLQEPASSVVSRLESSEKDDLISRKALMQRLHDAGGCGAPPESWADGYDKAIDGGFDNRFYCGLFLSFPHR